MNYVKVAFGLGLLGTVGIVVFLLYQGWQQAVAWSHPARSFAEGTPSELANLTNWEAVQFTTSDNLELQGWLISPVDPVTANGTAVILLHGLGGNR